MTAQPPELRLVQPQYYPCFVGPLQASGAYDARLSPPEMNLGKPTDKQKKKCVGEEWAPYWTETPSEFKAISPLTVAAADVSRGFF